ncbi:MAG: YlxR family protein [Actinobacteria bacterium]|nr:MAG: YlxR family protein [Actinomycetota bacterium]
MAPRRTCVGCRRTTSPAALVRVVRTSTGDLAVGRHQPGRGAWVCAGSTRCVDLARRRDGFSRALRAPVDRLAVDTLRATIAGPARDPGSAGGVGG